MARDCDVSGMIEGESVRACVRACVRDWMYEEVKRERKSGRRVRLPSHTLTRAPRQYNNNNNNNNNNNSNSNDRDEARGRFVLSQHRDFFDYRCSTI